MPPTVPAPTWRLWATASGVRGGSGAPRGCAGAARRLAHLPAPASPLRWGPAACGRKTSGPLPSRCAGRSRPPGSYGVSRPPRPSRRRGRPPALAPPSHRPGWAEDQPRPRPPSPPADPTAWRWPAAGGGCQLFTRRESAASQGLRRVGAGTPPGPRSRRTETAGSRRNQPRRPCYPRPHPRGCSLLRGVCLGARGSARHWATEMPRGAAGDEGAAWRARWERRWGARSERDPPIPSPPAPLLRGPFSPAVRLHRPLPRPAPWGLLPAESSPEQGRLVTNLNSNLAPLGRPWSLLDLVGSAPLCRASRATRHLMVAGVLLWPRAQLPPRCHHRALPLVRSYDRSHGDGMMRGGKRLLHKPGKPPGVDKHSGRKQTGIFAKMPPTRFHIHGVHRPPTKAQAVCRTVSR